MEPLSGAAENEALTAAWALEGRLHEPGVRNAYRALLHEGLAQLRGEAGRGAGQCSSVGQCSSADPQEPSSPLRRRLLLRSLAAFAEDARYGAGQLSRGAQRAPTLAASEEGWQRVEQIVRGAEGAAEEARQLAAGLEEARVRALAERASASAQAARRILSERNRAYTFQTRPGYSFGEGWYLAAAAVLHGLPIQIEPGGAQEARALRFLSDAGLASWLVPFRARPASPKHLTTIIAEAFAREPDAAQRKVREAFLGKDPPPSRLTDWIEQRCSRESTRSQAPCPAEPKVLLWVRQSSHDAHRNTRPDELAELSHRVRAAGLTPIYFGDALPREVELAPGLDLSLCWKEPLFQGEDMRRLQLHFFEQLRLHHGLVGQVGVTTAGMDGPALLGLPTAYFTDEPNARLGKWVGVVPGYVEIVRGPGSLTRVGELLNEWCRG